MKTSLDIAKRYGRGELQNKIVEHYCKQYGEQSVRGRAGQMRGLRRQTEAACKGFDTRE
jgi:hypothetical protein